MLYYLIKKLSTNHINVWVVILIVCCNLVLIYNIIIVLNTLLLRTWYVQKVSRILNFRGLRIFDFIFFVALSWYSCPSLIQTSSAILNVQFIFDSYFAWMCFGSSSIFAFFLVLGTRKSHREPDLGNTVILATLLCCFWSKIRAQTTMCEQERYHGAKANFCSSTKNAWWNASRKLRITCR